MSSSWTEGNVQAMLQPPVTTERVTLNYALCSPPPSWLRSNRKKSLRLFSIPLKFPHQSSLSLLLLFLLLRVYPSPFIFNDLSLNIYLLITRAYSILLEYCQRRDRSPASAGGRWGEIFEGGIGYLYIYIPGVDKILTRSPRDAAEFHYANSRREPPRKESWNNLHLGILATTRPRARNRPSPRPTWRGNPLGDNNTGGKIESV